MSLQFGRKHAYNKAFKSDSATRASFASLTVWHASRHALTRRYEEYRVCSNLKLWKRK